MSASAPPMVPRWALVTPPPPARAEALARTLALPVPLAALLVQRGHDTEAAAKRFLRPALEQLTDPQALVDLSVAVDLITEHVRRGSRIMVHGDYDVDGQCATAVLTRALRQAGADVLPFVPHRMRDGYDFGPAGLAEAGQAGVRLIVTCDCGITAVETVRAARAAGIDVVVTDHHLPGPVLPPANAVVDPQRAEDTSGLTMLCGTGIAFKLVQALTPRLGLPAHFALHCLDLVALATVADVVPLVDENRILVKHGLRIMANTRWPGLRALLASAGLMGREIRAGHLGFILGPRLNAAGRVGDAADGLRLLLLEDPDAAAVLAGRLETLNAERQALDSAMLDEAMRLVEEAGDPAGRAAFVLAQEGWHTGVVGIVASRVVERYGRPTFLIGIDGGVGKGSGRSISSFDLHHGLSACADLLERFGGHRMAAGVTIRADRVEAFRARFEAVVAAAVAPEDLGPEQRVDLELSLGEATGDLERLCRHLEPCGMGNPGPVFGVRGVMFAGRFLVGNGHVRGRLEAGGTRLDAIGFQFADRTGWLGNDPVDAAFRLERNEYRGEESLQARLVALAPHRKDP